MYILKNAIKNVGRNRGRNLIIGIIILGMIISTVVVFSINTTTDEIIKEYKSRFGSEVSITPDMKKFGGGQGGMVYMPVEAKLHFAFAESEYLKESRLSGRSAVTSNSVKAIDEELSEADSGQMQTQILNKDGKEMETPTLSIKGNSTLEALEEFKKGERKIIEGDFYKEKDECIISKELAEKNNLKVGDFINIKRNDYANQSKEDNYKIKVTGIYFDGTDPYGGMPMKMPALNKRNEVLTNIETLQGLTGEEELYIDGKYYLKSPDMLEAFEKEIRAKGLSDDYIVATDEASYNRIVGPVEGLGSITIMFLGVVLSLGSVILVLLNNLSIRERKYEIGVLRAIGMKKWKVATGLIIESLIVTLICLGIGIGVGSMVSQPVSNSLLDKQVQAQSNTQNLQGGTFVSSLDTGAKEETISEIDVKMNIESLLKVAGISVLIVLISSSVGVFYITKYEPSKILRERG